MLSCGSVAGGEFLVVAFCPAFEFSIDNWLSVGFIAEFFFLGGSVLSVSFKMRAEINKASICRLCCYDEIF